MGLPLVPIAVKLLLGFGPTLLRKLGKGKGDTTESVANTIAEVIEGVSDQPEDKQQAAVAAVMRGFTPEQAHAFSQLQVDLERIKQEGAWKQLEIEKEKVAGDAAARVAELHQTDVYTKQTRPVIARQSWYISAIYAVAANVYDVLEGATLFNWEVFIALGSPAMLYMGVRGFEKWKHGTRIP